MANKFDPRTYNVKITSDNGEEMVVECGPNRTRPDVAIVVHHYDSNGTYRQDYNHGITDKEWQRALIAADERDAG